MAKSSSQKSSVLLIIVAAAVVTLLIIVLIVWQLFLPKSFQSNAPVSQPTSDKQVQALEKQGTSDETSAIEKDVQDTRLNNLDQELPQIEKEIVNLQ